MRLLLLISLLLLSADSFSIVGGITNPTEGSFLSVQEQAALAASTVGLIDTTDNSDFKTCSAVLLSPRSALTAAHCVFGVDKKNLFIVTSPYTFALLQRHAVVAVDPHPDYHSFDYPFDQKPNFDLAILKFETPVPDTYASAALANLIPTDLSSPAFVAGYGLSSAMASDQGELRISKINLVSGFAGKSYFKAHQADGFGVCHGDSGGPVFIKDGSQFLLIGITSMVSPKDHTDLQWPLSDEPCLGTSFFNSVPYYQNWIVENLVF